jgi:hypothetical protein
MRKLSAALLLALGPMSFIAACSDGDSPPDVVRAVTYPVIGNAVLGKGVVMLSKQSDAKQFCTAVLLNRWAMLTTARCVQNLTTSQVTIESEGRAAQTRLNAELVRIKENEATLECINGAPDEAGRCWGKPKQVIMHRENPVASGDADNDLAILFSDGYGWKNVDGENGDYADIYMGDLTPGNNDLEITGYGWTPDENGPATFYPYRASLPLQQVSSGSLTLWATPNARPCAGDQGSPYTVPGTGEVVGLHSYNQTSEANGCASTGYVRGTRIRDKMGWIEGLLGKCQTGVNGNGEPIKRCYVTPEPELECNGAPHSTPDSARWDGCRGSGCWVCAEKVPTAQYPRYFENHPQCLRNTTCAGQYFTCSVNCPKPTAIDQAQWGVGLKGVYQYPEKWDTVTEGYVPVDPASGGAGTFSGDRFGRLDKTVNFNWGNGAPLATLRADQFTVRWRGWLKVPTTGTYTFQTYTDDGVTLDVNGVRRITAWVKQAATTRTSSAFTLSAGPVAIAMDYFDSTGGAVAQLRWKTPGSNSFVTIPAANLSPPGDHKFPLRGTEPG